MKDKTKLLHERALITCVIMLFLCIILKLFGFQWFNLDTDIPILKEIDKIVSTDIILSFFVTLLFKTINGLLVCSIVTKDVKIVLKHLYLIIIVSITSMVLNFLNINSFILDTIGLYIVCFLIGYHSIINYLLTFILNIIFQCVSLYIKNLGISFTYYGFIENKILSIDYYIMLIITYLHLKKGGNIKCGEMIRFGSSLANRLWRKRTTNSKQSLQNKER